LSPLARGNDNTTGHVRPESATLWRSGITTSARIPRKPTKEKESKRKQNRFLLLFFPFFYFSESSLFKGLWPKKVEKISLPFHSRMRLQINRLIRAHASAARRPVACGIEF
jgi:hypothetical protein